MSYGNKKNYGAANEMVSGVRVKREIKGESDMHSDLRRNTIKHICAHARTQERERVGETEETRKERETL